MFKSLKFNDQFSRPLSHLSQLVPATYLYIMASTPNKMSISFLLGKLSLTTITPPVDLVTCLPRVDNMSLEHITSATVAHPRRSLLPDDVNRNELASAQWDDSDSYVDRRQTDSEYDLKMDRVEQGMGMDALFDLLIEPQEHCWGGPKTVDDDYDADEESIYSDTEKSDAWNEDIAAEGSDSSAASEMHLYRVQCVPGFGCGGGLAAYSAESDSDECVDSDWEKEHAEEESATSSSNHHDLHQDDYRTINLPSPLSIMTANNNDKRASIVDVHEDDYRRIILPSPLTIMNANWNDAKQKELGRGRARDIGERDEQPETRERQIQSSVDHEKNNYRITLPSIHTIFAQASEVHKPQEADDRRRMRDFLMCSWEQKPMKPRVSIVHVFADVRPSGRSYR